MKTTNRKKSTEAKPLVASLAQAKQVLIRNFRRDLKKRVIDMHRLAHDMCGAHRNVHEKRAELRETKKLVLQLVALVE